MKREEAQRFVGVYGIITGNQYSVQIDKIYDSLEKQKCSNCYYCRTDSLDNDLFIECYNRATPTDGMDLFDAMTGGIVDFSCSGWTKNKI